MNQMDKPTSVQVPYGQHIHGKWGTDNVMGGQQKPEIVGHDVSQGWPIHEANWEPNPMYYYSEESPNMDNETYSQESVNKIAAWSCHTK